MPILFASYSGLHGGSERILLDVLAGAREPAVLACPPGGLADRARGAGMPVLELPARRLETRTHGRDRAAAPLRLAAHGREVSALASSLDARVVVAWGMRSALAVAAALGTRRRRPRLVFEHVDLLPAGAAARAVRAAAHRFDAVVALSAAIARDLDPDGALAGRLHVVRPGVPVPDAAPGPPPADPPSALLLGALVPWKRPDLALDAVALAAREVPGLRLVVAGEGIGDGAAELRAELEGRAAEPDLAGRVSFAGRVERPTAALAAATCLLHCADREPYGMVMAEALAAGRPVVGPAAGGALEIVGESCGRLYPPGDARAAACALAEVCGDAALAARLGAAGHERAHAALGLDASLRAWREAALGAAAAARPAPRAAAGRGLALVTVAHDSAPDLERLLASAARHLPAAHVVVVDSGSTDESLAVARRHGERLTSLGHGGRVTAIDLGANEGFGRGSNRGVAALGAGEDVAVLVNPDVELVDASLEAVAAELRRSDRPERLLAPIVLRPDGSRQDSAQPAPGAPPQVLRALVPPAALPGPLRRWVEPFRARGPRRVAWAVGCCVAGRTETLRRLGPFDAGTFLYGEDLDLGLRAAAAGVETWFVPDARVIHREAHSSAAAFGGEPVELLAERRRAVVAERLGPAVARRDDLVQMVTFADRIAIRSVLRRPAARERAQLAALRRLRRRSP